MLASFYLRVMNIRSLSSHIFVLGKDKMSHSTLPRLRTQPPRQNATSPFNAQFECTFYDNANIFCSSMHFFNQRYVSRNIKEHRSRNSYLKWLPSLPDEIKSMRTDRTYQLAVSAYKPFRGGKKEEVEEANDKTAERDRSADRRNNIKMLAPLQRACQVSNY